MRDMRAAAHVAAAIARTSEAARAAARDGAGAWLWYSTQTGEVRRLNSPSTLAAFIA